MQFEVGKDPGLEGFKKVYHVDTKVPSRLWIHETAFDVLNDFGEMRNYFHNSSSFFEKPRDLIKHVQQYEALDLFKDPKQHVVLYSCVLSGIGRKDSLLDVYAFTDIKSIKAGGQNLSSLFKGIYVHPALSIRSGQLVDPSEHVSFLGGTVARDFDSIAIREQFKEKGLVLPA